MNMLRLIIRELLYRKVNFALSLLAVTVGVGLFVSFFTTGQASQRETRRNLRDMGQNLRIIAGQTDMGKFWDTGYSDVVMPESWVYEFENVTDLFYSHLTATLQRKIDWDGRPAVLTGLASEVAPPDRKKPSMTFNIERGTAYVGYQLARSRGLKRNSLIDLLGQTLRVERTLTERGSTEDIRIYVHLKDAQAMLELPGQINEIQALDCYCRHPTKDTLTVLREQLATVLPGARVVKMQAMALAREKQRTMMEDYFALLIPVVVLVGGIWISALTFLNTRDRHGELGILRALGCGSLHIGSLFLGRSLLIGLVGAALGFSLGTGLALTVGPDLFQMTAQHIKPDYRLLGWSLLLAPAFAVAASFIPSMMAVVKDPAVTLRNE
jgi:putative ABC transport system permease protein